MLSDHPNAMAAAWLPAGVAVAAAIVREAEFYAKVKGLPCSKYLPRHYHDAMPADLRAAYSWVQLGQDYTVSVLRSMAVAMLWIACDAPQQWAWNSMQSVLAAYDDWPGQARR